MTMYKFEKKSHIPFYHEAVVRTFYGTIELRKVDDFNGKILVFVPLAEKYNRDDVSIIEDDDWFHLSNKELKQMSRKELKKLAAELSIMKDESISDLTRINAFIEKLEK